jgi:hypothetical protein
VLELPEDLKNAAMHKRRPMTPPPPIAGAS